jgi:hypothetical protein
MIQTILDLLNASEFYGESELIEIAKGKYELNDNWKKRKEQLKRIRLWQLKKQ